MAKTHFMIGLMLAGGFSAGNLYAQIPAAVNPYIGSTAAPTATNSFFSALQQQQFVNFFKDCNDGDYIAKQAYESIFGKPKVSKDPDEEDEFAHQYDDVDEEDEAARDEGRLTAQYCAELELAEITGEPNASELTCERLNYDIRGINDKLENIAKAADQKGCRLKKLREANARLACFRQKSLALRDQLTQMMPQVQQAFQAAKQQVGQLKSQVADIEAKQKEVLEFLGGSQDGSQREGLLGLRQQIETLAAQEFPTAIQGMEDQVRTLDLRTQNYHEMQKIKRMELTKQCFTEAAASQGQQFSCTPVGNTQYKSESSFEAIVCAYRQGLLNRDIRGTADTSKGQGARADAKAASLRQLLTRMVEDFPDMDFPSNPESKEAQEAFASRMRGAAGHLELSSLEQKYRSTLDQNFSDGRFNVGDFVFRQLRWCHAQAGNDLQRELTQSGSGFTREREGIFQARRALRSQSEQLRQKWKTVLDRSAGRLLRMPMGHIEPASCVAASGSDNYNQHLACMRETRGRLQGLLNGTLPNVQFPITIKGNGVTPPVQFACRGLDPCITGLQNLNEEMTRGVAQVKQNQQQFITQANSNLMNQATQMANQIGGQFQQIQLAMNALQGELTGLGFSENLNLDPIKGETLKQDEDGLHEPPQDLMAFMGGLNSNIFDPNSKGFDRATIAIERGIEKFGKEKDELMAAKSHLEGLRTQCPAELEKLAGERMQTALADVRECTTYFQMEAVQRLSVEGLADDVAKALRFYSRSPALQSRSFSKLRSSLDELSYVGASLGEMSSAEVAAAAGGEGPNQYQLSQWRVKCEALRDYLEKDFQEDIGDFERANDVREGT